MGMEERRYLKLWAIRLKKLISEFFFIFNTISELKINSAKTKGKHETFFPERVRETDLQSTVFQTVVRIHWRSFN